MHLVKVDGELIAKFVLLRDAVSYAQECSTRYPTQKVRVFEMGTSDPISYTTYERGVSTEHVEA